MSHPAASQPKVEYTAMLLGATGNVGGRILHLLVQSPLCKKVVVVTRRNVAEFANPKVAVDRIDTVVHPKVRPPLPGRSQILCSGIRRTSFSTSSGREAHFAV